MNYRNLLLALFFLPANVLPLIAAEKLPPADELKKGVRAEGACAITAMKEAKVAVFNIMADDRVAPYTFEM